MARKPKQKLTAEQRRAKRERRRNYKIVFLNGKQVRVKREDGPRYGGKTLDEFLQSFGDEWYEYWMVCDD